MLYIFGITGVPWCKIGYTSHSNPWLRVVHGFWTNSHPPELCKKLSVRVVKSDQTREPLDREKIRRGIERACSKRSIPSAIIERVVQDIETDIYTNYESEVTSAQVGDIVMRHLTDLDQVAYIRFASVYREFDDAQDFIQAISNIVGKRTKRL